MDEKYFPAQKKKLNFFAAGKYFCSTSVEGDVEEE